MRLNFLWDICRWDLQESVAVSSVFFPSLLLLPLTLGLGPYCLFGCGDKFGEVKRDRIDLRSSSPPFFGSLFVSGYSVMGRDPVNVNFSVKGREAFDQRYEHIYWAEGCLGSLSALIAAWLSVKVWIWRMRTMLSLQGVTGHMLN